MFFQHRVELGYNIHTKTVFCQIRRPGSVYGAIEHSTLYG